jgi:hypothetical protein
MLGTKHYKYEINCLNGYYFRFFIMSLDLITSLVCVHYQKHYWYICKKPQIFHNNNNIIIVL